MNTDRLNVALVTGAAGGIGLAVARRLHQEGMRVCLWDCRADVALDLAREPENVMIQQVDVTDADAVDAALRQVRAHWGGVSVLINNAGISPKTPDGKGIGILSVTPQEWSRVIDVNLTALLRLIQAIAPDMMKQGWGRIVNMASQAARTRSRMPGVAYVCAKSAVLGLSRYAADELGPHGITVNTLAPGRIVSGMTASAGAEVEAAFIAQTPVRRLGAPEDVAAAVAFYVSAQSAFFNGTILDVNGGLHMP